MSNKTFIAIVLLLLTVFSLVHLRSLSLNGKNKPDDYTSPDEILYSGKTEHTVQTSNVNNDKTLENVTTTKPITNAPFSKITLYYTNDETKEEHVLHFSIRQGMTLTKNFLFKESNIDEDNVIKFTEGMEFIDQYATEHEYTFRIIVKTPATQK